MKFKNWAALRVGHIGSFWKKRVPLEWIFVLFWPSDLFQKLKIAKWKTNLTSMSRHGRWRAVEKENSWMCFFLHLWGYFAEKRVSVLWAWHVTNWTQKFDFLIIIFLTFAYCILLMTVSKLEIQIQVWYTIYFYKEFGSKEIKQPHTRGWLVSSGCMHPGLIPVPIT